MLFHFLLQEHLHIHQQSAFSPPREFNRIKLLLRHLLDSDLVELFRLTVHDPKQNRYCLKYWLWLLLEALRPEHLFAVSVNLRVNRFSIVSLNVNVLASLIVMLSFPLSTILT